MAKFRSRIAGGASIASGPECVVGAYLRVASEPVCGLVEMAAGSFWPRPESDGYARDQYARVVAILLIDGSLPSNTRHCGISRRPRVPALGGEQIDSTYPDEFREMTSSVTSMIADEAEEWLL